MNSESISFLRTSDRDLAATLYCLGFDVDGIDKSNPKRVVFYFRKTLDLDQTVTQYWKKSLRVDPLAFGQAQRELMAKIHTDIDE